MNTTPIYMVPSNTTIPQSHTQSSADPIKYMSKYGNHVLMRVILIMVIIYLALLIAKSFKSLIMKRF